MLALVALISALEPVVDTAEDNDTVPVCDFESKLTCARDTPT